MKSLEASQTQISSSTSKPLLTLRSKIVKCTVQSIQEKKGEQIILLDLKKIDVAVSDFCVICEASNPPQRRAIADHIENQIKITCGDVPFQKEGYQTAHWIVLDYINIVVHIMSPETRKYYSLEELWIDANQTIIEE